MSWLWVIVQDIEKNKLEEMWSNKKTEQCLMLSFNMLKKKELSTAMMLDLITSFNIF